MLVGGILQSELKELQKKALKYDKLKEAIGKIKEDIEKSPPMDYYRNIHISAVLGIIDKHTEGLI